MESMWYTKEELRKERKHLKKILQDITVLRKHKDCYRGIEVFANGNRKNRYRNHVIPVLQMHCENVDDDSGLRAFAMSLNRDTTKEAIRRGTQDAAEAYEVYQSGRAAKKVGVRSKSFEKTTYKACSAAPFRRQKSINTAPSA